MRRNYVDTAILVGSLGGKVLVETVDGLDGWELEPANARRLAKSLVKFADIAERKMLLEDLS